MNGFRSRLVSLTRKEFRQLLRDRSNLAIGILLPMVLILIFGYGMSLDVKNAPVAVVMEDASPTAHEAVAGLQLSPTIAPVLLGSMHDAEELMRERKVDGIVRVPGDFSRRLAAGDARIQLLVHGADAGRASIVLRYATSLGIDHREARRLSGMPVEPPAPRPIGRWIAAGAALVVVLAVTVTLAVALDGNGSSAAALHASTLPPPWKVSIDVLNGSGDINYTRRVASRVGSFGYRIQHVTRANRFDYRETSVYFEPGGGNLAERLASQLGGVPVHPLPGGNNKRRLVVIVGPAHATG